MFDSKNPPYVIAELSANHNNSINFVLKSIEASAKAGASAFKTQLFTAGSMGIPERNKSVRIEDANSPWNGFLLYDLYEQASMPYEWYPSLIKCAESLSIEFFASVFDLESLDYAVKLDLPIIKISSFDIVHHPLLKAAARTTKPIIFSTGMATDEEVHQAHHILSQYKSDICLLECISNYPASESSYSIKRMLDRKKLYNVAVGISDHCLSHLPSIVGVANGASVIEKHFLLDKSVNTLDHEFSVDYNGLKDLVESVNTTWNMLNSNTRSDEVIKEEAHSKWERPSLYFNKNLPEGHIIEENDLIIRRPGLGLPPAKVDGLVNRKLLKKASQYSPVYINYFLDEQI